MPRDGIVEAPLHYSDLLSRSAALIFCVFPDLRVTYTCQSIQKPFMFMSQVHFLLRSLCKQPERQPYLYVRSFAATLFVAVYAVKYPLLS